MTIKDCVIMAADSLSLDRIATNLREGTSINTQDQRELNGLLSCAYLVIDEIGSEYTPLIKKETITTDSEGFIYFSGFSNQVVEILSIRQGNKLVNYRAFAQRVLVSAAGECEVEYSYSPTINTDKPKAAMLEEELPYAGGRISPRLISFGICSEYCIRNGMTDEAILYDRRYKDALFNTLRTRKERKVRRRSWL